MFRPMKDIFEYGDTLSGNDMVTQHYESLPYPPFGEDKIEKEVNWYEYEKTPYETFASIWLEKVNHFLRKGKENFR